jgi:hypothetical protein
MDQAAVRESNERDAGDRVAQSALLSRRKDQHNPLSGAKALAEAADEWWKAIQDHDAE